MKGAFRPTRPKYTGIDYKLHIKTHGWGEFSPKYTGIDYKLHIKTHGWGVSLIKQKKKNKNKQKAKNLNSHNCCKIPKTGKIYQIVFSVSNKVGQCSEIARASKTARCCLDLTQEREVVIRIFVKQLPFQEPTKFINLTAMSTMLTTFACLSSRSEALKFFHCLNRLHPSLKRKKAICYPFLMCWSRRSLVGTLSS